MEGAVSVKEEAAEKVKAWFDAAISKSNLSLPIKAAVNYVKW